MSGCTFERNGRVLTGDRLPFYRMGREEVKPGDIMLMIVTHTWLYDVHCACAAIPSTARGSEWSITVSLQPLLLTRALRRRALHVRMHRVKNHAVSINDYSALN